MPNLHWPDTLFTHDSLTGVLFTCDFLGAHFSWPELLYSCMSSDEKEAYEKGLRSYYQDIMSPSPTPLWSMG